MTNKERFNYLLEQYLSGKISIVEHDEFLELLNNQEYDLLLDGAIQKDLNSNAAHDLADLPPHIAQEIIRNIYSAERNTAMVLPVKAGTRKLRPWLAAASVILLAVCSYLIFINRDQKAANELADLIPSNTVAQKNDTDKEQLVVLADGSTVLLKPGSKIHYHKSFNDSLREVYVEGEAFFKVAKDPNKPFLVYYDNIVTKVLGTSFRINTNAETGNPEVSVKTGRVQVFENAKLVSGTGGIHSVIVTPNQKAVYQAKKGAFETALVNSPELIMREEKNDMPPADGFIFEQQKLPSIFKQIETAYGIEILVENANLDNCAFTGDVSGLDLFTKLKIICMATNSSYEVNGTRILVKGTGCK